MQLTASLDGHDAEHLGSLFALEIDGTEIARFTECSGLSIEAEVVEYKDITADGKAVTRKRPGSLKYTDIVLKRGLSANTALTDWVKSLTEGKVERKNGSIVIYDLAGARVDQWTFLNAWPSKWSASDLNAGTDDIVIEELTLAHEQLIRGSA